MRKSREKRLADARASLTVWISAVGRNDRRVRFMSDMIVRLERGKGLSTRQRSWLDSLCSEGPPAPKGDPVVISRIDAALPHAPNSKSSDIIKDFRSRLARGYDLSPKQEAFLENLLQEAEHIRDHGPWVPSDEVRRRASFAAKILMSRGSMWKSTHSRMYSLARQFTAWEELEGKEGRPILTEFDVHKLIRSVGKGHMSQLDKPRFQENSLVYVRVRKGRTSSYEPGIVVGQAEPINGKAGYPILVGGDVVVTEPSDIRKTPPKQ